MFFYKNGSSLGSVPFLPQAPQAKELEINDTVIKVEIADTQAKRSKGLGGKVSLASGSGMLFVFDRLDKYPFWMKGLSFPLDFIWIKGLEVVDILENIQPPASGTLDSSLQIYSSNTEVDKVLEVNTGFVKVHNIKVGDTIKLSP